jgi:GNAT superfamily N-acetyltransferase
MPLVFGKATNADAAAIAALRMATARSLAQRHGAGPWSFALESEASVQAEIRTSTVLFARDEGLVVGTARLATRNPWLVPTDFFIPCARPIFLTAMAVAPARQRQGIGRRLIESAKRVAIDLRGEAIRLDSYQGPAGAGDFYVRCGFREVWRGDYNATALVWFEQLLVPGES